MCLKVALRSHPTPFFLGLSFPPTHTCTIFNWCKGVIPVDMDQLNELRDGCGTTRPHNRPLKKRRVEGAVECLVDFDFQMCFAPQFFDIATSKSALNVRCF